MLETTSAYKIAPHEDHHFYKTTTTTADKGFSGHSRCKHHVPANLALFHARYLPLTVITTGPGLQFPERSAGVRTQPGADYMYGNAPTHSVKTDMDHSPPSGSGLPPISPHQQSQSLTNQFTQSLSSTHPSATPQNPYPAPHQDAQRSRSGPSDVPSALAISSPVSLSSPALRAGYANSRYPLLHTHPPPHTVPPSPPFVFPHPPGAEPNIQHLAYTSRSMMSVLQQPYQRRSTDPTPSPHQAYAAGTTVTALPIYSHTPLTPPPSSPLGSRQPSTGHSSEVQRLTMYPSLSTYPPMGYASPPPFAYPQFVPLPSIYGSHYPPSQYAQPYGSPPKQEHQGVWWYPPPGACAAGSSIREPRQESRSQLNSDYPLHQRLDEQPYQTNSISLVTSLSPTGKYPAQNHLGSPSGTKTDAGSALARLPPSSASNSQTKTECPLSKEGTRESHQERRSYHPKTPANRSEWVMWVGNVPSHATTEELLDFFNRPPPPPASSQSGSWTKPQRVHGGVSSVFLIARSNCAFVNFESEAQLEAATARFHGESIHPDDLRCPPLVCRVRRRTDDLKAGVGAQRGNSMHVQWIKEQRARVKGDGGDLTGLARAMKRSSSPLSLSDDVSQVRSTSPCSSHSGSLASTDSGLLSRYFPQRYFILKSLTQHDLDLSVQRSVWATQPHNEEILDQAYRTSKDVYLIFGVNKSGEFYGYARMTGPIQQGEDRVPWASRPTSPGSAPLSQVSAVGEEQGNASPVLSPESQLRPLEWQSFARVQVSSAPAELRGFNSVTHSAQNTSTGPPYASIPLKSMSLELNADAPYRARRDISNQSMREAPDPIDPASPGEQDVSEHGGEPLQTVAEERAGPGDTSEETSEGWGRPFRVDWIRTTHLPFFRTRHLRNLWNHGREVKVSRDGTELEPNIGRQLLEEWDKPPPSPTDVLASSSRPTQRRRGSKSTQPVL